MTTVERFGWGDGAAIEGTPFRTLVATAETDGRLVVLAAEMAPGLHVPEHTHDGEEQITVVLSGTVDASVGGRRVRAEAGGVVLLPRGVPHAQWNEGDVPARILEIYTPGGFEQVFEAAGNRAADGGATHDDYVAARSAIS